MRNGLLLSASLALAAHTSSCRAFTPPLTPPEQGGPAWLALETSHFSMRTNVDEEEAKDVLEELETMHVALHDLVFPYEDEPKSKTRVVHFATRAEYAEFGAWGSDGEFRTGGIGDDLEPLVMTYGDLTEDVRRAVRHELTHRFAHFYYPKVPTWFDEGLARYCETLDLADGRAVLGRAQPDMAFHRGLSWSQENIPGGVRVLIPTESVPPAKTLIAMQPRDFYAQDMPRGTEGDREEAKRSRAVHYAAAWALVHLLRNGPDAYRARLAKFVDALGHGKSSQVAWSSAFADGEADQLERGFRASLTPFEITLLRTPYVPRVSRVDRVRVLPAAEVHALWAELRGLDRAEERDKARADVEVALRLDPRNETTALMKARIEVAEGRIAEAERTITQAAASGGEASAYALFRIKVRSALVGAQGPDVWKPIDTMVEPLSRSATSGRHLAGVARYLALRGKNREAESLARRAVSLDAGYGPSFDALAIALADRGANDEAIEAESAAVALLASRADDDGASFRKHAYSTRAAAARGIAALVESLSDSKCGQRLELRGLPPFRAHEGGPSTRISVSLRNEEQGRLVMMAGALLVDRKLARIVVGRGHARVGGTTRSEPIFDADLARGPHEIAWLDLTVAASGYELFGLRSKDFCGLTTVVHTLTLEGESRTLELERTESGSDTVDATWHDSGAVRAP